MSDVIESGELRGLAREALKDLLNNLTLAKDFVVGQAPDFCQQLIAREWVQMISLLAIGLLLSVLAYGSWLCARKERHERGLFTAESQALRWCAFVALATGAAILVILPLAEMASLVVAPKVFLVEEIRKLTK